LKNLILALLLLSAPASAEWARVNVNEESDTYIDLATILKQANIVAMDVMFDYKTAHQWTDYLVYWSLIAQKEFDCDAGKVHTLDSLLYFERMGNGSNVYTIPGGASWRPVPADGVDAVLWKVACKQ
jgi:hypothetical protein